MSDFTDRLAAGLRHQRAALARASLLGAAVAFATVTLLGLSGWFITAAAIAGATGPAAAAAFNYLLPSAAIRALAIVRTGARYGERLAGHVAAFAVLARIRPALYRAIAASPAKVALAVTTGEASARLIQDVGTIEMAIARRPARAGAIAAVATGVALLLGVAPAAVPTLALVAAAALAAAGWTCRTLAAAGRDVQRCQGALRELLAIQLAAGPELRCYGMEEAAIVHIAGLDAALAEARRRQAAVHGRIEAIGALATSVAAVGVFLLSMPRGAPVAALAALAAAAAMDGVLPALRERATRSATREAEARLGTLFVRDPSACGEPCPPLLSIDGVGTVPPTGTRIALVGASGIGKTTLVETLIGLRDGPDVGVRIGDAAPPDLSADTLRTLFAWAPQDAQLIAGTVRDNLVLANPAADDQAIWSALEDACIADLVRTLPYALDSWVGENGDQLSGGERRRLSLARAYLSHAPWLLLDEPTEALDARTERAVVRGLLNRLGRTGQGLIVVTHRDMLADQCTIRLSLDAHGSNGRCLRPDFDAERKSVVCSTPDQPQPLSFDLQILDQNQHQDHAVA
ncbi:amino acid ABC transporter ATP-binding/permease protein [Sphingomonas melonis]|uniref:amino acid ABC transporter ATP-binding/permease protein n=1 Tax=Sphingomonas melonis TaxID=152682 RepID=UPI00368EED5C